MNHNTTKTETEKAALGRARLATLDVVRGVALCGIAFVNIPPFLDMYSSTTASDVRHVLDLFVQQRFFPIFSFLFGIGFGMMYLSAQKRAQHPRRVMVRRAIVLIALGALHQTVHQGEALLPYGVVALLLLVPATFLPQQFVVLVGSIVGAILTLVGAYFGGMALIPGLFVLGYTAAHLRLPQRLDRAPAMIWAWVAGLAAVSTIGLAMQWNLPLEDMFGPIPSLTGLVMAFTYIVLIVALMTTPLRPVLTAIFQPLGRMALTNYLTATAAFLVIAAVWTPPHTLRWFELTPGETVSSKVYSDSTWLTVMAIVAVILIIQTIVSTIWLRIFKQGPLEKAWRFLTWVGEPTPSQPATALSAPQSPESKN